MVDSIVLIELMVTENGARETCKRMKTLMKFSQSMTVEEDPTCSILRPTSLRGVIVANYQCLSILISIGALGGCNG